MPNQPDMTTTNGTIQMASTIFLWADFFWRGSWKNSFNRDKRNLIIKFRIIQPFFHSLF